MIELGSLWSGGSRLVMVAVRSFVGTVLALAAAGAILALCSFLILKDTPAYALIAAVVALLEALATSVVLGGKRALIMALAHGLSTLRLGRTARRSSNLTPMRIVDPQRGESCLEKRGRRALVRWSPAGERKWMARC